MIAEEPAKVGQIRSSAIETSFEGVDVQNLQSGDTVLTAFGSSVDVYIPSDLFATAARDRVAWQGPRVNRFTAHALRYLKAADAVEAAAFLAYDEVVLDLTDEGQASVAFELPTDPPIGSAGTVSGTLDPEGTNRQWAPCAM